MGSNSCLGVRKGSWTREEDILLKKCIENYGEGKWHLVPLRAGLNRCRKSCRLRWLNYLRPNINRGKFSKDEVDLIVRMHKLLGNRWSLIAGRLPGRTANDVKNFWNTHIDKKLATTVLDSRVKEKDRSQKIITSSNITRPQPRTFSRFDVVEPISYENQTNDWTDKDKINHMNKQQPSSSTTSIRDDVDECFKWWNSLLQETEHIEPGLYNPAQHDEGLSSLALDVDDWGLDSFHHQTLMPFN